MRRCGEVCVIWGVDPGVSGAVARLGGRGGEIGNFAVWKWSQAWSEGEDWWGQLRSEAVYVEDVHGSPIMGTRAFAFGRALGQFEGRMGPSPCMTLHRVTPQRWQRGVGFTPPKDKKTQKAALEAHAASLGFHASRQCADALLIALYGWKETYGPHLSRAPI